MKTYKAIYLIAGLLFISSSPSISAQMAGNGTQENPFKITTKNDLMQINSQLSACYILLNDIDLSGENITRIGSFENPFTGEFNGTGKTISNAKIIAPSQWWTGFFGYIKGGTIKNLILKNITVNGGAIVGGLVAQIDGGKISNCNVSGTIISTGNLVGGLIGCIYSGSTDNTVTINNILVSASVSGNNSVGALIGECQNKAIIKQCVVTGDLKGNNFVGGAIGNNGINETSINTISGIITHNLIINVSTTKSPIYAGRLIGKNNSKIKFHNLYAEDCSVIIENNTQGLKSDSELKDGLTVSKYDLQTEELYRKADFLLGDTESTPWKIVQNYPTLSFNPDIPNTIEGIVANDVIIYPNPASTILYSNISEKTSKITVYTSTGIKSLVSEFFPINIETFSPGIYFLQIFTAERIILQKFIKK